MNLNGGNARLVGDGSKTDAQLRGEIAYVRRDSFWIEHDDKRNEGRSDGGGTGDGSGSIILENFGGVGVTDGREDRTWTKRSLSRVLALTVGAFALGILVSPLVRTHHVPASGPAVAAPEAAPAVQPPAAVQAAQSPAQPPVPAQATEPAAAAESQGSTAVVVPPGPGAVPAPIRAEPPAAVQGSASVAAPPSPGPVTPSPELEVSKEAGTDSKAAPVAPSRTAVRSRPASALGVTSSSAVGAPRPPAKKSPAADSAIPREAKKASDKPASDDATKDGTKKDRPAPTTPKAPAKAWVDPWAAMFAVDAARVG